ncbi:hypothetical protein U472_09345 [Orenia metallireducens]|uniref:Uncharacterized protein n=1 Tax=Orenia metallireducens TaxID=1413210 RepID=A0A1C0A7J0_9FIRM|nr:DUF3006 domain-containing protein [Orenia metallireducens]OCL26207.1 hypothetical protein U472_09345 [Orenia metallireducens]
MLIIDRFEGDYTVIKMGNKTFSLPKEALPKNAREGDVLKIVVDKESNKDLKKGIDELVDEVFE